MPATTTTSANNVQGHTISGRVHGGQNPIQGAHVYLLAVNLNATSTYGGPGIPDSSTNQSPSLLTGGAGQDSLGYYVTTDSNGDFTITGDYTCPSAYAHPYLYSVGGYPGTGTSNSAITLMAALNSCDSSEFVIVNEVATVAATYAFAGFASDPTHVSAPNTALAQTALNNAANTITNLVSPTSSTAIAITPAGNGTVPQAEINTLANILAACVNSTGSGSTQCATLFSNAMNGNTAPADTATALLNIAHNPGANVGNLIGLQTGNPPFQPMLTATPAPNDFTIAVSYTGGGINGPVPVAIDGSGNVWVGNTTTGVNSVSELNPVGAPVSGSSGYTGGGVVDPYSIAIDNSGNVWTGNVTPNSLSEFNSAGSAISGASGYTGGGLLSPWAIAFDGSGDVWVVDNVGSRLSEFNSSGSPITGSSGYTGGGLNAPVALALATSGNIWVSNDTAVNGVSEFNSSGTALSGSGGYTGGGLTDAWGIAIDGSGNVWAANSQSGANSISELNSSGTPISPSSGYTGGGLSTPNGIAIDGSNHIWVANRGNNTISEFNSSGTPISGSTGFMGGLNLPLRLAVDGSGNVWVTSTNSNAVVEFVGAASPVATPIVANLTGASGLPTITNIQPNPAPLGASVTITGANFGANQGGSTVTFNGTTASPTSWSATGITVPVPAAATTGNVVVTVGGEASNGYAFMVSPNITNIQPNPAAVGTSVTITGTSFGATQDGSTVTFNGVTASPSSWSATSITAPVPAGATTGSAIVTVGGQPSAGYSFTVSPAITNIQPNPAAVGTSVTITGTSFGATQGASTLTFNGTTASPSSWSDTSITAPVPSGATTGNVVVTVGGQASSGYAFTVSISAMPGDALTWRYDNSRDGLNSNETTLTTANVNSTTFGKVGEFAVDGRIDGEVLYVGQISISGQMKNVVYFATENGTVYAVDADSISGTTATVLWSTSLVPSGEAPAIEEQTGNGPCGNISFTGALATPVIDRGRNAIYAVSKTMSSTSNTTQFFRIHALDLTTGNELFGGPTTIAGTYPGTVGAIVSGGIVTFSAREQNDRAALLESGNNIYVAFGGSYGDCGNYSGWLISYNADTLAQTGAIDLNPNSTQGGMWNGQAGPSADTAGSVYVVTANAGDTSSIGANDYPVSVVRLTNNSETLAVADYWTPYNATTLDQEDLDLGSAGLLLLPDLVDNESVVHHYAVAAGKDGNMYVLNRDNLGQFNSSTNKIVQTIAINGSSANQNFSTPAYFNNNVYVCPSLQTLKAFAISNAMLATSATMSTTPAIGTYGFTISANGTSNGIVWAIQPNTGNGVLYAFDASNLSTMLYASNQASGNRDQTAPILGHFHTPTVANGKVYLGTGSTVAVFGLLP